jgi:hypothetical protein
MKFEIILIQENPFTFFLTSPKSSFMLGIDILDSMEVEGKKNPVFAVGILEGGTTTLQSRCSIFISTELIEYRPVNEEHERIERRQK